MTTTAQKPKLIVTYGIHSDGDDIKLLAGRLNHIYDVYEFNHPKRWALSGYSHKKVNDDAKGVASLAKQLGGTVDFMGHSYGALLGLEAMQLGAVFNNVFLFGAAASSDKQPLNLMHFNELHNYYNPRDRALWAGAKLPLHPFGKLGYLGNRRDVEQGRVFNHDTLMTKGFLKHSGYFNEANELLIRTDIENIISAQARHV